MRKELRERCVSIALGQRPNTIVKAKAHFENTKGYLRSKRKADPRFEEIECDA